MADETDELLDAITAVIPPVLTGLETLAWVGRHLHPPNLAALVDATADPADALRLGRAVFDTVTWPEHLADFSRQVGQVAEHVGNAFDQLAAASTDDKGVFKAYRALGQRTRALEALYPIAQMLPPVSRFFLDAGQRDDENLHKRLQDADGTRENVGVMHAANAKGTRGGFSMYVPEYYDEGTPCPLIVALHGGSGHGRDFLWTWLATARSCGAILVSPTARGDTWSLMGPDIDSSNLDQIVGLASEQWNIDSDRLLLTGMSDGGTFTYVSGLRGESPFTHLAPCSASFHPMLIEGFPAERMTGLPIFLMHGALDWMFPVDVARMANECLTAVGAQVLYREIDDLSHTWPSDENPHIINWFLGRDA